MALIYADIVKLKNINRMISAENQCDDFSPPPAMVLMNSNLEDAL